MVPSRTVTPWTTLPKGSSQSAATPDSSTSWLLSARPSAVHETVTVTAAPTVTSALSSRCWGRAGSGTVTAPTGAAAHSASAGSTVNSSATVTVAPVLAWPAASSRPSIRTGVWQSTWTAVVWVPTAGRTPAVRVAVAVPSVVQPSVAAAVRCQSPVAALSGPITGTGAAAGAGAAATALSVSHAAAIVAWSATAVRVATSAAPWASMHRYSASASSFWPGAAAVQALLGANAAVTLAIRGRGVHENNARATPGMWPGAVQVTVTVTVAAAPGDRRTTTVPVPARLLTCGAAAPRPFAVPVQRAAAGSTVNTSTA